MLKITFWFLILFICFFLFGLNAGEVTSILNSGASICLSCIGVG